MVRYTKRQSKKYRQQYYCANKNKALEQKRENYECNADIRKDADKQVYRTNAEKKKYALKKAYSINADGVKSAAKTRYASNPEAKKEAVKAMYASNPEAQKGAVKARYASNPEPKKRAVSKRYTTNPEAKKKLHRQWYSKHSSAVLQKQSCHYYASIKRRRAARLLRHAVNRSRDNAKNKLYRNQNKKRIVIEKTAKRARYVLTEPKTDVKEKYVQNMKTKIHSKPTLKRKLLHAFRSSRKPLADKIKPSKLCNAVSNIAARKLLNKVLKVRKQSVGELLSCIRSVTALKISTEDLGKSRHTASSEPFFYDQSYAMVRHTSPIAVDSHGRCVIAEEEGKRNEKSNRPKCWKCTAECKLPTPREVRSIMSTKALFEQPVQKLREALNTIDECIDHGHYSRPLNVLNSKGETLYYELAGHPLPCTSDCQSSLRVLRAAATHFPQLRRLVCLLYDAIRQHRLLESIDTALCAGDLEKLLKLCAVSYDKLFRSIDSNEDSCGTADSEDAVHQPIRLQQPKLPDLESHLHVEHAQVIADIEKKVF